MTVAAEKLSVQTSELFPSLVLALVAAADCSDSVVTAASEAAAAKAATLRRVELCGMNYETSENIVGNRLNNLRVTISNIVSCLMFWEIACDRRCASFVWASAQAHKSEEFKGVLAWPCWLMGIEKLPIS
ncbi:hypothetical protein [Corynebacterium camporealensis]